MARLARHIATWIAPLPAARPPTIIDFGGGDGSLAIELARQLLRSHSMESINVVVVDFHDIATYSYPRIRVTRTESLAEIHDLAQVVLASAILEHLPEANAVFHRLFELMDDGGYFYARTPWTVPMTKLIRHLDMTYPFHVHDMGAPFWNRVLQTFRQPGRVVFSGPSPVETDLIKHPARTLAAVILKLPARVERMIPGRGRADPLWRLVGGWEVMLRRDGISAERPEG